MRLSIAYDFLPKQRSLNTSLVMDLFGVDFDQGRHVIADNLELDVRPGDVVLFTGPSGSGKSSLLRAVAAVIEQGAESQEQAVLRGNHPEQCPETSPLTALRSPLLWLDRLSLPERPLADALPLPVQEALELLSACGLGEAQLLLRTPAELSDGQRYRFRLALGLAELRRRSSDAPPQQATASRINPQSASRNPQWLVADEFCALLDRTTARVIAYNAARLARRTGIGLLLATTHEDIGDDLDPDLLVRCDLDGHIAVSRRPAAPPRDASRAPGGTPRRAISFFPSCGSVKVPRPTGRTSLGGITAATASAWSGG